LPSNTASRQRDDQQTNLRAILRTKTASRQRYRATLTRTAPPARSSNRARSR